jgi:hypothetical protein
VSVPVERVARRGAHPARLAALALASLLAAGCLGEPEVEDRWTRLDVAGASLAPGQAVQAGTVIPVTVSADLTYRRLLTGFAVAELRASTVLSPAVLQVGPQADRLRMANDIDRLLATSVSMGRETRAVTGWDHLIQRLDFSFAGAIPAAVTDSLGTGPVAGLFLVCYLGSGVEVELPSGRDSVIVTPFPSNAFEILPVGLHVTVTP